MSALISLTAFGHVSLKFIDGLSPGPVRNANSATGDGRASVNGACGGQNTWGSNGQANGVDGQEVTMNINYAAGHASNQNVFSMAYSCTDTSGNGLEAAAAKLTAAANGCTCETGDAAAEYPCPAPQAIVDGGYTIKCTLPTQDIPVGATSECTVSLLDQRDWGGCTDLLMASAAATLPPAPPPAPIIPNDGSYEITEETMIDTSAASFTCCPLEATLDVPTYVEGAASFTATLTGKADGCRTSSAVTAPNDNDMTINLAIPFNVQGSKYSGTLLLGTPAQSFEFILENKVLSFTNIGAEQPIICDGFSAAAGGTVGGQQDNDNSLGAGGGGSGSGQTTGLVVAVLVILVLLAGGYWFFVKKKGDGAPATKAQMAMPPPAPPMAPGWQAAMDPATGRTYYVNAATGQSQWEPPAGMAPPPPPSAV